MSWFRRFLPPYTGSSADTIFGMSYYGSPNYEAWWFKPVHWLHRLGAIIDSVYYWIRWRTFDRYHIVKTDLDPGYYDVDEIMFRACFALLGRFVEEELGTENWFPDQPDCMYRGYRVHCTNGTDEQAIDLWIWYKRDLAEMERDCEAEPQKFRDLHGYYYIEKQKTLKLDQLIRLRTALWT